jgi:hypothetical protein
MKKMLRLAVVSLSCLSLILLVFIGNSFSQNKDKLAQAVDEVADALEKGDVKTAEKKAEAIAKNQGEVYEVMLLFKDRDKKGFGVGPNEAGIQPDGIEKKIRAIANAPLNPMQLKAEADALVRLAYRSAAAAKIAEYLPNNRKPALWLRFARENYQSSMDLVKDIRSEKVNNVKTTVSKINAGCNSCHSEFR